MTSIRLRSVDYKEHAGSPLEWSLVGLALGQVNLLVGRNASGKTRTLNLIANLAKYLLSDGQLGVHEADYDVRFDHDGRELRYRLVAHNRKVIYEQVIIDGKEKLSRDENELRIDAEELGTNLKFAPPSTEIAAVSRRDRRQHPFLLPLHEWAESVRHYHFGAALGKNCMAVFLPTSDCEIPVDDRDENSVVAIFMQGARDFPDEYVKLLLADMSTIGYDLLSIEVSKPGHISLNFNTELRQGKVPIPGHLQALGIVERGQSGVVYQDAISQGMFRALSILAQVNYALLAKRAACIIVDDIGEGLDYERSSGLIKLLREKANASQVQIVMATNDQFVMNNVPLSEWSIIQRKGGNVTVRNIHNSREAFEEFRFVGLSNFAFFEMDYVNSSPDERGVVNE